MSLKEQIQNDLKEAMKAKDAFKRDVLRLFSSAIKQEEVDQRKDLSDEDVISILKREIKRRQETIADLQKAGRDLTETENEITILNSYLPAQMDRAQVEAIVKEVIAEVGAQSVKEMGHVMKVLMPRLKGQADGKLVNDIVRQLLG